jgi:sec-independent protein translocase protein TatA
MIGTTELIIIGLVILVLFGAAAIPKFARSLGKAKKEFQEGLKEGESAAGSVEKGKVEDEKY